VSRLKIAFVASGGAARGLAHLGVLKACEELGIHPEIYVGTGAGALLGATYGQDIPLDVLLDAYRLPWRRRHRGPRLHISTFLGLPTARDFADPGYLLSGAFSLDKLEKYVEETLPINDFTKLPHTVLITAVDLDTAERVVFGPGYEESVPISRAVAASACVPGLFRPYRIGGRYYVSGEVAKTLSADLAIDAGADVVIISNVYRPEKAAAGTVTRTGVLGVIRQSMNILFSEKERRGVELYSKLHPNVTFLDVAPDVGHYGYGNRFAARPLVLRGYRTGLRVLAEAKERGVFDRTPAMNLRMN
jgi:NTE family protein